MLTTSAVTLTIGQLFVVLGFVVGGMLVAGLVVIRGRKVLNTNSNDPAGSLIRSWVAIALVMGLLVYCAAALYLPDSTTRSTMFGGLIASVAAAVAFYFSSQGSDQARADILNAAVALSQGPLAPTAFTKMTPPAGTVGTAYGPYTFAANGAPTPTFTLESGTLPAGLSLSSDGTLSGTPTAAGPETVTIRAITPAGHVDSPPVTITIN